MVSHPLLESRSKMMVVIRIGLITINQLTGLIVIQRKGVKYPIA